MLAKILHFLLHHFAMVKIKYQELAVARLKIVFS